MKWSYGKRALIPEGVKWELIYALGMKFTSKNNRKWKRGYDFSKTVTRMMGTGHWNDAIYSEFGWKVGIGRSSILLKRDFKHVVKRSGSILLSFIETKISDEGEDYPGLYHFSLSLKETFKMHKKNFS